MTPANRFLATLCAVTFLPLIGLPIAAIYADPLTLDAVPWRASIFIVGYCHVAATFFFYLDHDARELRKSNSDYFFVAPIFLVIGVGLAYHFATPALQAGIFLIHSAWLFYHYQKQNYGVISFAAKGLPPSISIKLWRMLLLAAIAGYLSYTRSLLVGLGPMIEDQVVTFSAITGFALDDLLFTASVVVYAAAGILFCKLLYESAEIRGNGFVLAFTIAGFVFFLPSFLIAEGALALFWSFAGAHGLQYLLFMTVTATPRESGASPTQIPPRARPVFILLIATLAGGTLITLASNFAFGLVIGITWLHFVIDSRVWKLRRPDSRAYVVSKFSFLFKPTAQPVERRTGATAP